MGDLRQMVRLHLNNANMTQQQLADQLGIAKDTFSRQLSNGYSDHPASQATFARLQNELQLQPEEVEFLIAANKWTRSTVAKTR